jgi:hypothetical protein
MIRQWLFKSGPAFEAGMPRPDLATALRRQYAFVAVAAANAAKLFKLRQRLSDYSGDISIWRLEDFATSPTTHLRETSTDDRS